MRRLHILHVIGGLGLGGAERMMIELANASVRDGYRVSVCVTKSVTTLRSALDPAINCFILRRQRKLEARGFATVAQYVRDQHVDVVHAHERSGMKFLLPLAASGLIRVPILMHDHYGTIETDGRIPLWFRLGHVVLAKYIGVYERLTEWALEAGMRDSRTLTIPNAINIEALDSVSPKDLRAELSLPADHMLALHVSTLRRDKAIETMLEGLARSKNKDRVHIAVAGTPSEAEYVAQCKFDRTRFGVEQHVTFLGGRTDVPSLLKGVDFAVFSSDTEAGPLVLLEYLAASLPIVSTRVGETGRRLAGAGVEGFVEPRDVAGFARELDRIVELDAERRRQRAALGREVVQRDFDIRSVMPRWYSLYAEVAAT